MGRSRGQRKLKRVSSAQLARKLDRLARENPIAYLAVVEALRQLVKQKTRPSAKPKRST